MPTHLTRHVFRAILANEPIVHRGCLYRRAYSSRRDHVDVRRGSMLRNGVPAMPKLQKRTFLNFNIFARRKANEKEADMDPGIDTLMTLAKMQRLRARLPPPEDVAEALRKFFAAKSSAEEGIEDTQAQLALQALRYCLDNEISPEGGNDLTFRLVSQKTMQNALHTIYRSTSVATDTHVALAKGILDDRNGGRGHKNARAARTYVKMLCAVGRNKEAREFVEEVSGKDMREMLPLWNWLIWGYSKQTDERELLAAFDQASSYGLVVNVRIASYMLDFYLRQERVEPVQKWFTILWDRLCNDPDENGILMGQYCESVLRWCLKRNQLSFGHEVVRKAMGDNPPKPVWDATFVWAAGTGKGADEINRMMSVMESTNTDIADTAQWRRPDITTINALVEYATSKDDPYLAERFIALGKERGILPDARTYVLQMEYRLKVQDVDGALIAYTNLQSMDLSSNDDLPSVNKLIVAMCNTRRHDFETIMNVAADLSDRRVRFEPPTVSRLALLHLSRDEVADVVDLLNTHSFHYSSSERESIRNAIFEFCIHSDTPLSRSWDAYTTLRNIFDEMPRSQRTAIMTHYFHLGRPDMAVHVFNGMRMHSRADTIPIIDTYVAAFVGSAKLRDVDSLELVHNQLKLDYNININTYLRNALIIGYTACGKPRRAIDFWDDIVASREGPTYNSIHIALRACEKAPFGDLKAQEIWDKLRKQKVELDQSMWASYAAALAGNGDNELAVSTMERAEADDELEMDAVVIGSLVSGAAGQSKQAEIITWAAEKYPHISAELEQIGFDVDEAGMKTAKIDRTVTP